MSTCSARLCLCYIGRVSDDPTVKQAMLSQAVFTLMEWGSSDAAPLNQLSSAVSTQSLAARLHPLLFSLVSSLCQSHDVSGIIRVGNCNSGRGFGRDRGLDSSILYSKQKTVHLLSLLIVQANVWKPQTIEFKTFLLLFNIFPVVPRLKRFIPNTRA